MAESCTAEMSTGPKVSIIIPNFNHGSYLKERIVSVLNQTFQDFELIYLDDASTDESYSVFSEFEDSRIRALTNTQNSGSPFVQWNRGVRMALGEYVWIAESDDFSHRDFLKSMVAVLDENPGVGLAYCQSYYVDDGLNHRLCPINERWEKDYISDGKKECEEYFLFRNVVPNASATVFRRKVYEDAGYADEDMQFCGDWMMWAKMSLISNIAYVAQPLNYYRKHALTVSARCSYTLLSLEEWYRIVIRINQGMHLSKDSYGRVCLWLLTTWISYLKTLKGLLDGRRNLRIVRLVRELDHKPFRRLIRYWIFFNLQRLHLLGTAVRIKRVVRRLIRVQRTSPESIS